MLSLPAAGPGGSSWTSSSTSSGSSAVRELMAEKHAPPPETRAFGQPWMHQPQKYALGGAGQVRPEPERVNAKEVGIKQEHVVGLL